MTITVPERCLVVLIGATASGKSTFASKHFRPAEVISSDACRALIAGDENALGVNAEAFDLVHTMAATRLTQGRIAAVDATNVLREARRPLLALARDNGVPAIAIVLDLPEALLLQRSRERPDRSLLPHVVRAHRAALRRSLHNLRREGFLDVHVLTSTDEVDSVAVQRVTSPSG